MPAFDKPLPIVLFTTTLHYESKIGRSFICKGINTKMRNC